MEYTFIVNPTAGRGQTGVIWQELARELDTRKVSYRAILTTRQGEATEIAQKSATRDDVAIVAVGGDGTITEVVNGMVGSPSYLGIIPTGSGNDLARTLELPQHPLDACLSVLGGHPRAIDLGRVNGRHFINVAGAGFDAEICKLMNDDLRWLKGMPAYVVATVTTLFRYSPVQIEMELDGDRRFSIKAMLVSVANGRYYGGGMKIAPEAEIDDGLFDVCILEALSKPAFLTAFPRVYEGKHVTHPRFSSHRARKVRLTPLTKRPVIVQADGEVVGNLPLEMEVVPKACRILVGGAS